MLLVVLDHLALASCAMDGVLGDPVERVRDIEVDVVDGEFACIGREGLLDQAEEGVEPKVGEIGYAQEQGVWDMTEVKTYLPHRTLALRPCAVLLWCEPSEVLRAAVAMVAVEVIYLEALVPQRIGLGFLRPLAPGVGNEAIALSVPEMSHICRIAATSSRRPGVFFASAYESGVRNLLAPVFTLAREEPHGARAIEDLDDRVLFVVAI